jgi:hypothetical protein
MSYFFNLPLRQYDYLLDIDFYLSRARKKGKTLYRSGISCENSVKTTSSTMIVPKQTTRQQA